MARARACLAAARSSRWLTRAQWHYSMLRLASATASRHASTTTSRYAGHVPTSTLEKAFLAGTSAAQALADPRNARAVGIVGETTGHLAFRRMRDRMRRDAVGADILRRRPRVTDDTLERAWVLFSPLVQQMYTKIVAVIAASPTLADVLLEVYMVMKASFLRDYRQQLLRARRDNTYLEFAEMSTTLRASVEAREASIAVLDMLLHDMLLPGMLLLAMLLLGTLLLGMLLLDLLLLDLLLLIPLRQGAQCSPASRGSLCHRPILALRFGHAAHQRMRFWPCRDVGHALHSARFTMLQLEVDPALARAAS